jgi:hypothetical protein
MSHRRTSCLPEKPRQERRRQFGTCGSLGKPRKTAADEIIRRFTPLLEPALNARHQRAALLVSLPLQARRRPK